MAGASQTLKRCLSYAAMAWDTVVLRRVRPYLFILVINDACNLNCFYCACKNRGHDDLDAAAVRRALVEAYARGLRALVLTGGEPFVWRSDGQSLPDVVAFAQELGFLDIAIFTNGTFPLAIGGVSYIVTVDGTREAHDRIRSGSYDRVIANVRAAKSKVIASMTLSQSNAGELEQAVGEISASGLFSNITFNLLTAPPEMLERHGFVGDARRAILDRIWSLKRRGFPIMMSRAAYGSLRANTWKRPIGQIELFAGGRLFTCCRDVVNPDICRNCGYTSCAEISRLLDYCPSAAWELINGK